ncbi:unnamed protein product, partial [Owenia fusiformis]
SPRQRKISAPLPPLRIVTTEPSPSSNPNSPRKDMPNISYPSSPPPVNTPMSQILEDQITHQNGRRFDGAKSPVGFMEKFRGRSNSDSMKTRPKRLINQQNAASPPGSPRTPVKDRL